MMIRNLYFSKVNPHVHDHFNDLHMPDDVSGGRTDVAETD